MAVGAIIIGIDILKPKTVVVMSILLTSIRIRGRNLYLIITVISKNFKIDTFLMNKIQKINREKRENKIKFRILYLNIEHKDENLTEFLRKHFCFLPESIGPLLLMHSSHTPSWAIFPLQWPHTH